MQGKFFWVFCAFGTVSFAKTILMEGREEPQMIGEEPFKVEPHIFENKILEAMNKLKDFLWNGNPEDGIPPLDPFFLSYRDFDFFIMDTELKGYLRDTTFANFSRFEVEKIEFKILPLHFKLDLLLDRLAIDGRYKLEGKILNQFPVNGAGRFTSETKNLTLSLYLRPTQVNSALQIQDLILEFKALSEKINYTNELLDDEVRVLDENLVLLILEKVQEKYVPPLLNLVKEVLNHFLLEYSFVDIIKIIFEFLNKH